MSITETQDQIDAKEAANEALYAAERAIIDAAVCITEPGKSENYPYVAVVQLRRFQELQTALNNWRAVGGMTTDEWADAESMLYGKGTGFR